MKQIITSPFSWTEIQEIAKNYNYVVILRNHHRGNGVGEFFETKKFNEILKNQPFWFNCDERPVHTVILTNEDIPSIVDERERLISKLNLIQFKMSELRKPQLQADNRSTRRTQPAAWALYDKEMNTYNLQRAALLQNLNMYESELKKLPNYSVTLLQLS